VFPKDGYKGDYIKDIAAQLHAEHGAALESEPGEGLFRETAENVIFADIRRTLERLGIHFDVYYNETSLYTEGHIASVLQALRDKGVVYDGDGAVWLRSSDLSLSRDRVLVKSSGEPTYLLPDIAYHREKFRRGFERVIDVMGADHIDQFPYVRAAMGVLGFDSERIELVLNQFVTITRSGEKVKQSTRRATFITVDELVDDVGVDVFRFFMVERKADGHLDFDLDLAQDRNWRKNPAYTVQYAYARTFGIERTARDQGVAIPGVADFDASRLALPEELELVKKLGEYPETVERAAATAEPHHIAYYLRDVAGMWNPYVQDGARHRIVTEDAGLTAARLGLTLGVRSVLGSGLRLLGVSTPERM
jgi:arginyl-tRNA synthetase